MKYLHHEEVNSTQCLSPKLLSLEETRTNPKRVTNASVDDKARTQGNQTSHLSLRRSFFDLLLSEKVSSSMGTRVHPGRLNIGMVMGQ